MHRTELFFPMKLKFNIFYTFTLINQKLNTYDIIMYKNVFQILIFTFNHYFTAHCFVQKMLKGLKYLENMQPAVNAQPAVYTLY